MIYLFIWENYFRKNLLNTWKTAFWQKYSELNIFHITNYLDYELWFYDQNLFSSWFFSEKSLFIIDNFPIESWNVDENSKKYYDYFIENLPKINNENIIVFNNFSADKRTKFYKMFQDIWEIKDFSINDEIELKTKLKTVFPQIWNDIFQELITLKWLNFQSIKNELDKILLLKENIFLSDLKNISKDTTESIFEIINDILNLNFKLAIEKLNNLANFLDNNYFLYNQLIANLRVYFYIFYLKSLKKSSKEISEILDLWKRSFLIDKNYKIQKKDFYRIYKNLISIDSKMKTWKMIWSDNKDMIYEIEKSIIC